jgi:hypothetical protein
LPQLVVNNNLPSPCMQFGPFYPEGAKDAGELASAEQLKALFQTVDGIEAEVVEDMQTARWTKVIWVRPRSPPCPFPRLIRDELIKPARRHLRTPPGTRRRLSSRPTRQTC